MNFPSLFNYPVLAAPPSLAEGRGLKAGPLEVAEPIASAPAVASLPGSGGGEAKATGTLDHAPGQPARQVVVVGATEAAAITAPGPPQAPLPSPTTVSSFITPQSLASFAGGSTAVTTLWAIAEYLFPRYGGSPWMGFALSVFVGTAIYLISTSDENLNHSKKQKIGGAMIAFLNCMVLYSAALGARSVHIGGKGGTATGTSVIMEKTKLARADHTSIFSLCLGKQMTGHDPALEFRAER